jgi:hypothetical protein|tara:strand:+ start:28 stop:273 length:246 start_codon:yes stop_codon:yes gene_type:complete
MIVSYNLKKQTFYTWYYQNRTKEQIAAFLSPYLMNIVNKDVAFSLQDLLEDVGTIPSYLLENYPTSSKPNKEIEVKFIKLI